MNKQQLDTIKRVTGHSYSEIVKMDSKTFWAKITVCLAKGSLTQQQYIWLDKQRETNDLTPQEVELLEVFGGKLIK